ncbi:MAG: hypothetical protein A2X84_13635 [Desulfuromonadaceae bacterium GWC2_58_13]|nr:MAG: hypothetical protein A2X84_13635 [Desulfuromonadaceae bacterium GWC2_58_13]
MSFTGDLEHLPIVDVIQLLHSTRKSGTLCVKGGRGECQLVFNDGYIGSANHSNTSVRIGKILVDMRLISSEICEKALADQRAAGASRKPLIATLIEQGQLKKDDAYKGLKNLIEMTVVEMLRWTRGTFTLNVDATIASDEYRYFPEMLHQEINLDTQRVLMDALRVFDEQNRDGGFVEEEWMEEAAADTVGAEGGEGAGIMLSADDLGLGDIDRIERKIPEVFSSIEVVDPADLHRRALGDLLAEVDGADREKLVDFLVRFSSPPEEESAGKSQRASRALVFISRDSLARYVVMTLCKPLGILIFTTDDPGDLDLILGQSLNKGLAPLLIFDVPDESAAGWSMDDQIRLRQEKKAAYPQVPILQLAPADAEEFSLRAYRDGVRAVLPRPRREGVASADLIRFFETLLAYIKTYFEVQGPLSFGELKNDLLELQELRDAPELSLALLQRVAVSFDRALTFIVRPGELIAERGIGIGQDKKQGPSPPLRFKIPLDAPSLLHKVLTEGQLYFGRSDDEVVAGQLFSQIGSPRETLMLLLPVCSRGRALALIYADGPAGFVPVDSLAILAGQAGLILENALCRRQIEKAAPQG